MLNEDRTAGFLPEHSYGGGLTGDYRFMAGKKDKKYQLGEFFSTVPADTFRWAAEEQKTQPIDLGRLYSGRTGEWRNYWWFGDRFYWTLEPLSSADVMALALEEENRRRLKLEKAHALMAMREQLAQRGKRQSIPNEVKQGVWVRDGGRCVECGSNEALEFDHIIPLALGGANTERNIQLLCEVCNRRKGATLG